MIWDGDGGVGVGVDVVVVVVANGDVATNTVVIVVVDGPTSWVRCNFCFPVCFCWFGAPTLTLSTI